MVCLNCLLFLMRVKKKTERLLLLLLLLGQWHCFYSLHGRPQRLNRFLFYSLMNWMLFFILNRQRKLLRHLTGLKNSRSALTVHNTSLMTNSLTRPDCCFIMTENIITSLINSTDRELREGHNLEKLYKSGEFNKG